MRREEHGKGNPARRASGAAVSIALVLALSTLISWPLWSLATRAPRAYTIAFGAVLAILAAAAIVRARRRRR
jgi:hypothetical protein